MKVYIVFYFDDPYSGIILDKIFLEKEDAERYVKENQEWDYHISEEDLITNFNQIL